MNTSERFFRRYIFSTVRIIVLFLAVNALLVASYFVIAYLGNVATSKFPIEDFSNHIMATDGEFSADTQAKEMLNNFEAWAMILDDDGTVVWEENLPEELPRHYPQWILPCLVAGILMIIRPILQNDRMGFW